MTKVIFNRETHSPERLNIKAKDFISYKQMVIDLYKTLITQKRNNIKGLRRT